VTSRHAGTAQTESSTTLTTDSRAQSALNCLGRRRVSSPLVIVDDVPVSAADTSTGADLGRADDELANL